MRHATALRQRTHTYTHPTQLTLLEHRLQLNPPQTGQDGPAMHCSMYPVE